MVLFSKPSVLLSFSQSPTQAVKVTSNTLKQVSYFRSAPSMGTWASLGVAGAAAVAGAAILCNLPTNPFVKAPQKATLDYLSGAELRGFGEGKEAFKAPELWRENGAVIMAVRRPG